VNWVGIAEVSTEGARIEAPRVDLRDAVVKSTWGRPIYVESSHILSKSPPIFPQNRRHNTAANFVRSRFDHSKFHSLLTYLTYMPPDVNKQTTRNSSRANVFFDWNSVEPETFFDGSTSCKCGLLHSWQLQLVVSTRPIQSSVNSCRSELLDCFHHEFVI